MKHKKKEVTWQVTPRGVLNSRLLNEETIQQVFDAFELYMFHTGYNAIIFYNKEFHFEKVILVKGKGE